MKDFVNKTVFRCVGYDKIYFGRVLNQKMQDKWLWLQIKWEDTSVELEEWHKVVNVGILNKRSMAKRIREL